jgi:outer membrane protein OmpA-like peptidoglycan-associated protein
MFETIYFDANKSNINPTASKALDRNGMLLKDNPNVNVEIGGHSDGSGIEAANQKIAEKRAQSAKKYIQDKQNIPENQMTVKSYGSSKPVADNKTAEGRAKNRRVEFMIMK